MKFVLAITTYNRLDYLRELLATWEQTRGDHDWKLIVADDGSNDGTLEFLDQLDFTDKKVIKNHRIGVHNQMNSILKSLTEMDFDFCFKVDDDIRFLQKGWDDLYYSKAMETGFHHLVFHESKWAEEQKLENPKKENGLVAHNAPLNVHGFFYTISPEMIQKVGYFDVENFGFRGMGHVDYTGRACRAGFNDLAHPFDVEGSDKYLSAYREEYNGALPSNMIQAYDNFHRKRKEEIILKERVFVDFKDNSVNFESFQKELPEAFEFELERKQKEIEWYQNTYEKLPKWWKKIGALIRKTK
ncbi:MAG: glycosyltransferase family 2 protein [Crocinitomicaceae bacterium]|nr:glycosyltransferase family 2 protein [Crocinitomicaceae bacterium]